MDTAQSITPRQYDQIMEALTADRTAVTKQQALIRQRLARLEQRFARAQAANLGPRTPDPDPLPEHDRTEHTPINITAPESVRVHFTLTQQIKDFRDPSANNCEPMPTKRLHTQSALPLSLAVYGRYLNEHLREHAQDLITGPRRVVENGNPTQLRCLYVAPTDPLPKSRVADPERLTTQVAGFRETRCQPVLATQLWRESTDSVSRFCYLRDLKAFITQHHTDLEFRHRKIINPRTNKPFTTPWLVHKEILDV